MDSFAASGRVSGPAGSRRSARLLAVLMSVPVMASGTDARARDCQAPIQILYDAPEGCPGTTELTRQLISRTSNLAITNDGWAERIYSVTIIRQSAGFEGVLMVHSGQRRLVESRRIAREACGEVVAAMALVVAMIPPPPTRCWRVGRIGLGLPAIRSGAPRTGLALSAFVTVRRIQSPGFTIDGRITLTRASIDSPIDSPAGSLDDSRGDAEAMERSLVLDWLAIAVDVAVLERRLPGGVAGNLWTGVELGALRGAISAPDTTLAVWRPWVAPMMGGRVRWSATDRFWVELDAGLGFPLIRDRFFVEPGVEIHHIPPVTISGILALGVEF